jgi:hypothetical protein
MTLRIKILKRGDQVQGVFPYGDMIAVTVRKKIKTFEIILLKRSGDGTVSIEERLSVEEGDGEVEEYSGGLKITTF